MEMSIEMLGIGACCIDLGQRRLWIDALNEYSSYLELQKEDILLFTHADGDHFLAEKVVEYGQNILIIGPPSIAYPLLSTGKIDPERLTIMYPPEKDKLLQYTVDDIRISIIQTEHFIDWNPIHVSFLIEAQGKRVFVTGDSHIDPTRPQLYEDLDCLVYSLIKKEVVKGQMSGNIGAHYHLCEIQEIKYRYNPRIIVCNHVLNCAWSVDGDVMDECLRTNDVKDVFVPRNDSTSIQI